MIELVVAACLGLLLLVGREILTREYVTWAGALAKLTVRLAGRLDSRYRDEWLAEVYEVQLVRHESGLGFALGALLSSLRSAGTRRRDHEIHVPAAATTPVLAPLPDRERRALLRREALAVLGSRIREERQRQNLTQEALGERAGLHRTYIGSIERGTRAPRVYTIVRIAVALGIDPGSLVRGISFRDPVG